MAGILLNRSRQVPAEETPAFGGIAERFRRAGDLDRAIALCREGLKRFPQQLSARVTLGWALLDKGHYEEARIELEQVLRKAPDNLAAIRGLAEIHDRTEGALPAEPAVDDRSWKQDDVQPPVAEDAAVLAAAADAPLAVADDGPVEIESAGLADAPPAVQVQDPDAPLAIRFAPSDEPVEIVHTGGHVSLAGTADAPTQLDVEPVDVAPAAAALNAAGEPVPLQIDPPAESTEPFDAGVATDTTEPAVPLDLGIDAEAPVSWSLDSEASAEEQPVAATFIADEPAATGLDVFAGGDLSANDGGISLDLNLSDDALDLSGAELDLQGGDGAEAVSLDLTVDTGLSVDAESSETLLSGFADASVADATPAAEALRLDEQAEWAAGTHQSLHTGGGFLGDSPEVADATAGLTFLADTPEEARLDTGTADTPVVAFLDEPVEVQAAATVADGDDAGVAIEPEQLEDVDAEAGQDLADAIRTLEEASRRLEARLALRPVRNQPSASADEIGAVDLSKVAAEDVSGSVIDTSHDGAFELTAPALSDLSLGDDEPVDAPVDDGATLSFDFERDVVQTEADLEAVSLDTPGSEEPETSAATPAFVEFEYDHGGSTPTPAFADGPVEETPGAPVDEAPAEAVAALTGMEVGPVDAVAPGAAPVPAADAVDAGEMAPVMAVSTVESPVQTGVVLSARQQATIVALERFLRKVQARRLELERESVA